MPAAPDFPVVDVDSHVYEPEAIWTEYLPAEERRRARKAFSRKSNTIKVNGNEARPLNRSKINRQAVWRPGMTPEKIGRLDPEVAKRPNPGAFDPAARLADLDRLGIRDQVVFPMLFGEYFPEVEDPEAAAVLARAYNDWATDFAAGGQGRLHPAAVLPMQDPDLAVEELGRAAAKGLKAVLLRPMFYRAASAKRFGSDGDPGSVQDTAGMLGGSPIGVYLDHERFRPVWSAIEERGLVACVHPYLGIANVEATSEGSFVERVAERLGIGHTVAEPVAQLQDNALFIVIAAFHGLLEDHPRLKLAMLHAGASMTLLSLEKAETYLWLSPQSIFTADNPVSLEPEEVFSRSRVVVGFDGWESSAVRLHEFFATRGAWGSRYPHHDTSTPADAIALCERYDVPADVVRRMLGGNAAELFGIGVPTPA